MFWFCGGHGQCAEGNGGEPGAGTRRGLDPRQRRRRSTPQRGKRGVARPLPQGRPRVKTGPGLEFRSDDRKYRVAPQYPVVPGKPVKARGSGTLAIAPGATSGGATSAAAAASGGLDVPITVRRAGQLLGPPKVTLTYTGTGAPAGARIFAQLINVDRGVVVGNQSAPIPVRLDGRKHTDLAPARADRVHGKGGSPLHAPAGGGLGDLVAAARQRHDQGLADRRRAAGGRSARARAARAALHDGPLVPLRPREGPPQPGRGRPRAAARPPRGERARLGQGRARAVQPAAPPALRS